MMTKIPIIAMSLLLAAGAGAATYDVTDFGANGSDEESDFLGVQLALEKAKGATEAVTIVVPAGTYRLDHALHIYSNTRLTLQDGARFVRSGNTDQLMLLARHLNADGSDCPGDETCTHAGYSQYSNITIDGGIWDAASGTDEVTGIMRLSHGSGLRIEGVCFEG